jgi:hypothetical protein
MDSDNYGYYVYKDFKTYRKYDIMTLTDDIDSVKWYYNDDFFSKFDWTKEPEESLEILYKNKAEQLRNNYDYIILMYSSGSDSDNILETFVNFNIPLDEVCSLVNLEGSGSKDSFANREIYQIACPKIIDINKKHNLKIKHRVFDISKKIIETFLNDENDNYEWINNFGAISCLAKHRLYEYIPEWTDIIDSNKKICLIWGCEKPRISVNEDRFYFYFTDIIDGTMCLKDQKTGFHELVYNDLFYWSPTIESSNILIKQSHIIKKYLSNKINREYHSKPKKYDEIFITMKNPYGNLGDTDFKNLIYLWYDDKKNLHTKSTNGVFLSTRDEWFWQSSSQSSKNYLNCLKKFKKNIYPIWIENYILYDDLYPKQIRKKNSKLYPLQ